MWRRDKGESERGKTTCEKKGGKERDGKWEGKEVGAEGRSE